MASTVRIGDRAKRRLRRLQESWQRVRGEPPTQQQLLDQALAYVEDHAEQFLAEAAWRPLGAPEIQRLKTELRVRSGETGGYDIDEVVYGADGSTKDPPGGAA